jgi:prepilin-type processing-associated H-X9-DG protein
VEYFQWLKIVHGKETGPCLSQLKIVPFHFVSNYILLLQVNFKLFSYFSGQEEVRYPNGNVQISFADGSVKKIFVDGSEEIKFPDGTQVQVAPNGDRTLLMPNGQKEFHTSNMKVILSVLENSISESI